LLETQWSGQKFDLQESMFYCENFGHAALLGILSIPSDKVLFGGL